MRNYSINYKRIKLFRFAFVIIRLGMMAYSQYSQSAQESKGLATNDKAPEFMAIVAGSNDFKRHRRSKSCSVVLILYRGFNKNRIIVWRHFDSNYKKGHM